MIASKENIELLAPAGRWEAFTAVIDAGADAVYIGGKRFNMRMHRSDFNFTDEQMLEAVKYAHARNVKLYITVNNLLGDAEVKDAGYFLEYLQEIGVDAIVIQDLGMLHLVKQLGISLPVHISTMMNVQNTATAITLKELGVRRVVTSRDVSLAQAKEIREKSGLEIEYFVHGDLCISQSGQCYASGVLFGKSANRGECMKPCRWNYSVVESSSGLPVGDLPPGYFLAIKDLCLLKSIPDLVYAGICSFKIEGRMRHTDHLREIVGIYRKAIDAYFDNPSAYYMNSTEYEQLYNHRVRDFTTSLAFSTSSASLVDASGNREPLFLSRAAKESSLTIEDVYDNPFESQTMESAENEEANNNGGKNAHKNIPHLSVRVGSMNAFKAALNNGADRIYLHGEFSPLRQQFWTKSSFREACSMAHDAGKAIGFCTPRIATEQEMADVRWLFEQASTLKADYVLVHNLGALRLAKEFGLTALADYSLNVLNTKALRLLQELGASGMTASFESSLHHLEQLALADSLPVECIVHGPVPGMVLEHCVPAMVTSKSHKKDHCRQVCRYIGYALKDERGEIRPIEVDQYCRNHLLLARDICALPYLHAFVQTGAKVFRIEAQYYDDSLVGILVGMYAKYLGIIQDQPYLPLPIQEHDWNTLAEKSPREFNLGGYARDIIHSRSTVKVMQCMK